MLTKNEIRSKAEVLLNEIWRAGRRNDGRMNNDAEARLADLLLSEIDTRDRAIELLHMLDRPEARHPDVAAFLDGLYEEGGG